MGVLDTGLVVQNLVLLRILPRSRFMPLGMLGKPPWGMGAERPI